MSINVCFLSVFLCSSFVVSSFYMDFASSIAHLRQLLDTQKAVLDNFEKYTFDNKKDIDNLNKYLDNFKRENENAEKSKDDYLTNPLNAFTLIKRLTKELKYVEDFIKKMKKEYKRPSKVSYPTELDFYTAVQAIASIQSTYNLSVDDLAMGIIKGNFSQNSKPFMEEVTPMTVTDCYELGIYWKEKKKPKKAIKWLAKALHKNYTEEKHDAYPLTRADLVKLISEEYDATNDIENTLKWTRMLHSLRPNSKVKEKIQELKKLVAEKSKTNDKKGKSPKKVNLTEVAVGKMEKYIGALCRGEVEVPKNVSKSLKCKYLTESHPYLKLVPVKMEQLYSDPAIVMFHDLLTNEDIEKLKRDAEPKLKRLIFNQNSIKRTNKIAWFDDVHRTVRKATHWAVYITGMDVSNALPAQIVNYGIAGNYHPHVDFHLFQKGDDKSDNIGNRYATFMLYLSDVAQGGATVFLSLGLTVFPVKGSALFWYNLLPNGDPDYDTLHHACPVLKGDKWILNKWIHQIGQELLFPCPKTFKEDDIVRNITPPVYKTNLKDSIK